MENTVLTDLLAALTRMGKSTTIQDVLDIAFSNVFSRGLSTQRDTLKYKLATDEIEVYPIEVLRLDEASGMVTFIRGEGVQLIYDRHWYGYFRSNLVYTGYTKEENLVDFRLCAPGGISDQRGIFATSFGQVLYCAQEKNFIQEVGSLLPYVIDELTAKIKNVKSSRLNWKRATIGITGIQYIHAVLNELLNDGPVPTFPDVSSTQTVAILQTLKSLGFE